MSEIRDEKGRILPGHTLNPGGRPRKKKLEDYYTEEELTGLILRIKQDALTKGDIMKMVTEQIFGKAKQPIVGGDEDDNPIEFKWKSNSPIPPETGPQNSTTPSPDGLS